MLSYGLEPSSIDILLALPSAAHLQELYPILGKFG